MNSLESGILRLMRLCGLTEWLVMGPPRCPHISCVYGHEVVLPWELRLGSRRVTFQDQLTADDYMTLMKDELEDLADHRLNALINIEANKARVGRWYDKKVKAKSFNQGDLVWKLALPI